MLPLAAVVRRNTSRCVPPVPLADEAEAQPPWIESLRQIVRFVRSGGLLPFCLVMGFAARNSGGNFYARLKLREQHHSNDGVAIAKLRSTETLLAQPKQ